MGLDLYLENSEKEELVYWRKAWCIHYWFCKNLNNGNDLNCIRKKVTISQLKELRDTCQEVIDDKSKAPILLPWNYADYDEDYFRHLEYTIRKLDVIIEDNIPNLTYYAWY